MSIPTKSISIFNRLSGINPWVALDVITPIFRKIDSMVSITPPLYSIGKENPHYNHLESSTSTIQSTTTSISSSPYNQISSLHTSTTTTSAPSSFNMAYQQLKSLPPSTIAHHVALDVLISKLRARSVFHPHGFYPHGYGYTQILPELSKELLTLQEQLQNLQEENKQLNKQSLNNSSITSSSPSTSSIMYKNIEKNINDLSITLTPTPHGRLFATVLEGNYKALSLYETYVPKECRNGRFQLITPTCWDKNSTTLSESASESEDSIRKEMTKYRPIVVLLAGTGEQGFRRRRHCVAYPLARLGISSLIFESPYYGIRKPSNQHGSKLFTLMDLPLLGRITIEETRSIVKWLRQQTNVYKFSNNDASHFPLPEPSVADKQAVDNITAAAVQSSDSHRIPYSSSSSSTTTSSSTLSSSDLEKNGYGAIVLAGTSMGGLHAAMTASLLPYEIGVASWLGPSSANPVFTRGCLALATDWEGLCKDIINPRINDNIEQHLQHFENDLYTAPYLKQAPHSLLPSNDDVNMLIQQCPEISPSILAKALQQAARLLRITDITNFTPPIRPDASIFVTAAHDQYVPLDEKAKEMWDYIRNNWNNSEIRIIPGGHVTASLFALDTYVGTVVEVIRKLVQK